MEDSKCRSWIIITGQHLGGKRAGIFSKNIAERNDSSQRKSMKERRFLFKKKKRTNYKPIKIQKLS